MKRMLVASSMLAAIAVFTALAIARPSPMVKIDVPIVVRGIDRGGPASLAMVLGYYGADTAVQRRTDEAFDPKVGGASIAELAALASRLGYPARVAKPGVDSLIVFLRSGVPPIVCVDPKPGVKANSRYYVITQWDTLGNRFFGRDGGARPREVPVTVLQTVWEPGGKALIVGRRHR